MRFFCGRMALFVLVLFALAGCQSNRPITTGIPARLYDIEELLDEMGGLPKTSENKRIISTLRGAGSELSACHVSLREAQEKLISAQKQVHLLSLDAGRARGFHSLVWWAAGIILLLLGWQAFQLFKKMKGF